MTCNPTERSSTAHAASTRVGAARRSAWVLSAVAMAGLLTGCARMQANLSLAHLSESQEQFTAVDRHSSYPAIRRGTFEHVNLVELVDPTREHEVKFAAALAQAKSQYPVVPYGIRYDLALAAFRERPETPGYSKVEHRNAVQDRIMGVATSRCNVFKTHLRREQADTNFYLGAATTVAGVLGAILPGVNASRNLAGTAGIFSGLQAEFNSNYYSNLAAHVIVQGIEQHQSRLQTKIIDERRKLSIEVYGMEAAIKDAIYFDGTCSTVVGLLEAAESIKESSNPGLARSAEVIAATRAMHLIANEKDFAGLIKSGDLDKLIKQASVKSSPLVVTALAAQAAPPPPASRVQTAQQANVRFQQSVVLAAEGFQANYLKQQKELAEDKRHKDYPKLATALAAKLKEALLPLPAAVGLDKCTADLPKRAGAYQMALSQQILTPANDPKRPEVDAAVHKAAAEALLAADRVEWLLARLQEKVNTLSAALEKTATQAAAPELDKPLVTPAVTEDEQAFVKQCGAGA